jgi:hypothetical protein
VTRVMLGSDTCRQNSETTYLKKLVLGLVSCILVRSQMYEHLKRQEYPPDRGYDLMILDSIARL